MAEASRAAVNRDPTRVALLTLLLAIALPVSVVHYVDSVANFADYPKSTVLPNPSALLIALSWFAFTAAGVAGYLQYRRRPSPTALLLIAFYSGSGLVGFLHYSVPGALDMPWWRHLHVIADILLGVVIFGFAIWAARQPAAVRVTRA
ncbi:MAG: hypothetical protein Q7T55_13050 [Solirubrobacteraceae bacterium]|nr:hypothetical protein [Solirubrobacteraceae bacterium]